eukprot:3614069-Pyramimonas_sp.AAC.1
MARALFRQDWVLAQRLFQSHPHRREHLLLDPNTFAISLRNPILFTTLSNELHLKTVQTTERALQASAQRLSRPSAIARVSARARR